MVEPEESEPLYNEVTLIPRFVRAEAAVVAPVPPYARAKAVSREMDGQELRSYAAFTAEAVAASDVLVEDVLEDSLTSP